MKCCFLLISSHNDKFPWGWNHVRGMCLCLNSDKHHSMVLRRLKKTKTCKCYFQVITAKEACGPAIKIAQPSLLWAVALPRLAGLLRTHCSVLRADLELVMSLECNCFISEAHLCVPLPLALIYHLLYSNSTQTRPSGPAGGCEVLWVGAFSNQWH